MIKNIIKVLLISFVTVSCLFFVTKSGNYRSNPIAVPCHDVVTAFKDEGIFVQATAYTAADSKYYLNQNLLEKGFRPIQISIQNNTSRPLGLGDLSVDLPLACGNQIATQFFKDTLPRAFALKIASLFFWPFTVPSTIDGIITYKSQKVMRHDYAAKTIKKYEEIIPAYSTINRILFVKQKDYRPSFKLVLQDKETGLLHKYHLDIS
ncbi:MAG TPA: hypothetical protein VLG76_04815 [Rhabdochlamydiaceae bacterium]|nr:hypothetical protein [Rhabdochlamydiaceae bacterium]